MRIGFVKTSSSSKAHRLLPHPLIGTHLIENASDAGGENEDDGDDDGGKDGGDPHVGVDGGGRRRGGRRRRRALARRENTLGARTVS